MMAYWIIPLCVSIVMLFVSLIHGLPYAYFQILRWVACLSFCLGAFASYQKKTVYLIWVFVILAILFNPIAPIRFKRTTWEIIDPVTGVISIAALVILITTRSARGKIEKDGKNVITK